uniref:Uncharacterized protein n=1 Tax=Fibrocapsa japonica TaxID=94617 RepID=A0A7S2XYP3_9STRA
MNKDVRVSSGVCTPATAFHGTSLISRLGDGGLEFGIIRRRPLPLPKGKSAAIPASAVPPLAPPTPKAEENSRKASLEEDSKEGPKPIYGVLESRIEEAPLLDLNL